MFRRQYDLARFPLILVLALSLGSAAFAKKKPPAHPINLNTANATDLQQVPGIGPSTAQKILDNPQILWRLQSVDDLLAIKGIGPKKTRENAQVPHRSQATRKKAIQLPANRLCPSQAPAHKIPCQTIEHTRTHRKRRRRAIAVTCELPVADPFRGEGFHNLGNHATTKENPQA